jgi:hypothetical protein
MYSYTILYNQANKKSQIKAHYKILYRPLKKHNLTGNAQLTLLKLTSNRHKNYQTFVYFYLVY